MTTKPRTVREAKAILHAWVLLSLACLVTGFWALVAGHLLVATLAAALSWITVSYELRALRALIDLLDVSREQDR